MADVHSWADIDLQALLHNVQRARFYAPGKRLCAVIKANAYGHGVHKVAQALTSALAADDCVAVATLSEALSLRRTLDDLHNRTPILVLRGPLDADELETLVLGGFHWVLHASYQVELLKNWLRHSSHSKNSALNIWFKINTGMNRLGFPEPQLAALWSWLQSLPQPGERVLMSHFATADEPYHALAVAQQTAFARVTAQLPGSTGRSLSASAGIVNWPEAHHTIVRPGIMMYGASPMADANAADYGLQPVMSLKSRVLAVNQVSAGSSVGYGATYHCTEDMPIGVIGIGYADGYPRHAPSGTPVLIHAQGKMWQAPLAGRVSMDALTVDLRGIPALPGDEVLLWGKSQGHELAADTIARAAGTIAYELFCQVTARVKLFYR